MILHYFLIPAAPVLSLIACAILLICLEIVTGEGKAKTLKLLVALLGPASSMLAVSVVSKTLSESTIEIVQSDFPAWLGEFLATYQLDSFTLVLFLAISFFTLLALVYSEAFLTDFSEKSEIFSLLLFVAAGMMVLVSANSLLMVFMGLELMSLPTYVLVGLRKNDIRASEAALKYFLYGSFATVLLVLAIAFLYGSFGTLHISQITALTRLQITSASSGSASLSLAASMALLAVALGFKIGLAPFHLWIPDTYQGAPTPITGFMGSAIKLAGFGLAFKVFCSMFNSVLSQHSDILGVLALVTMFVGNLAALRQSNLKRIFAYSSISHAGYLFLAIAAINPQNIQRGPLLYYLLVYGLMFLGTFGILSVIENNRGNLDLNRLNGLGFEKPLLSACLLLFILTAAGIPPTAGFLAKYFVFLEAASQGKMTWVVLGVMSSLIGVYYYLQIIAHLYMKAPLSAMAPIQVTHKAAWVGILASAAGVIYFAMRPGLFAF
ncbi:MAG: NADH-quinone oxidoreductase subunit N [Proteobacteria bacterium]|nr:NADH-quinone oxidoreductase subunit N [Pseudomonadota bacterium]NDC23468.1 NADH-quinone oxidoreductase subunit N [Pseudomonadota bacterium]NDD03366.1 NADH-quinone oxidoreductase subunit N [Pseudomonadota bacterium]NDG25733.1 NADH-quinone oxidoreductase subunit N [Pseudomonadota bacterium]